MSTTVKGLFRRLRYITQIFEADKENEIRIGLPTDVEHVAHIGSDGPAANTPEKTKHKKKKTRRRSERGSQNGSPPRRHSSVSSSDMLPRRHHRSRHGSMDSTNDPTVKRKPDVSPLTDVEGSNYPHSDSNSAPPRKSASRHRKPKGTTKGELSTKREPTICNNSIHD